MSFRARPAPEIYDLRGPAIAGRCDCCAIEIADVRACRANWYQCLRCKRECPFYVACDRLRPTKEDA